MISAKSAVSVLGNTITKTRIRTKEVKQYCFTLNNYSEEDITNLKSAFSILKCDYIFGKEIGESGTPHLQGYIKLINKKSLLSLKKCLGIDAIHLECCKGTQKENEIYCTKDNNFESNYFELDEELDIIDDFKPWMLEIEEIIKNKADKRKVYWYWEPNGGVGKSSFCKYLCYKYKAIYIDEGKKSDIINIIYNIEKINSKSIIVIDIPRNNGNKVSYKAIEQIKNGMICNTKYETGMKLFNSPHIIIFSNYYPDINELSADRWIIHNII